ALSAGLHVLQVRFAQNAGNVASVLDYAGPDTNGVAVVVPSSALSTGTGTAGTLSVGGSSSLGSGPVFLANGVLNATTAVNIGNAVALTGGPLPVVLAGSAVNFNGANFLTGNTAL